MTFAGNPDHAEGVSAPHHFEILENYLPLPLGEARGAGLAFAVVAGIVVFRYFLFVAPFHWLFYRRSVAGTRWEGRRLYPELPGPRERRAEIRWSLVSSLVFAAFGVLLGWLWQQGWTRIYLRFDEWGWLHFFVGAPVLLVLLHDTYFYWTHRWLHTEGAYRRFHFVHHRSLHPSPWASFSFHPVEAAINAAAIPLIALVIPLHPLHVLAHLTLMTLSAITNHLGFEVLPSVAGRGAGKYLISGLHHAQHHRYFRSHFGLFFSFWDLWMKTERRDFWPEFQRKVGR